MYIPDNYDMWEQHERQAQAELDRLPRCVYCDKPIQQDTAVYINDEYICDECLSDMRREIQPEY